MTDLPPDEVVAAANRLRRDIRQAIEVCYGDIADPIADDVASVLDWLADSAPLTTEATRDAAGWEPLEPRVSDATVARRRSADSPEVTLLRARVAELEADRLRWEERAHTAGAAVARIRATVARMQVSTTAPEPPREWQVDPYRPAWDGGWGLAREQAILALSIDLERLPAPAGTPATPRPEHGPLDPVEQVLYDAYRRMGCASPVDPADPEDCASVAAETVRVLRRAGYLPPWSRPDTDAEVAEQAEAVGALMPAQMRAVAALETDERDDLTEPDADVSGSRQAGRWATVVGGNIPPIQSGYYPPTLSAGDHGDAPDGESTP